MEVVAEDTDLDLLGLIIVGTPDDNKDKMLVGTRAAAMAECMRADGVIISSDGWGNSDVDYTNTCEQLGIRGIPVTGLNFSGTVAKFVVENDYLDGIVDINKSGVDDVRYRAPIYRYAGKNYWKYGKGHRRDFACAE